MKIIFQTHVCGRCIKIWKSHLLQCSTWFWKIRIFDTPPPFPKGSRHLSGKWESFGMTLLDHSYWNVVQNKMLRWKKLNYCFQPQENDISSKTGKYYICTLNSGLFGPHRSFTMITPFWKEKSVGYPRVKCCKTAYTVIIQRSKGRAATLRKVSLNIVS